jgi:hypothetical protein
MIPWLLLLVRTQFTGSTLLAACAAAWQAGGGLVANLHMFVAMQHCLKTMQMGCESVDCAVLAGYTDVAGFCDQAAADAARQAMQQLQQRVQQLLLPAIKATQTTAAAAAALSRNAEYSSSSSSSNTCIDLVTAVQELTQHLQQCALRFCGQICVSSCCNNPACTTLSSSSEQLLVGGKQCMCSGCMAARYCSRECQVVMWPHHKQLCKVLIRQRQQQQQDVQEEQDQGAEQEQLVAAE